MVYGVWMITSLFHSYGEVHSLLVCILCVCYYKWVVSFTKVKQLSCIKMCCAFQYIYSFSSAHSRHIFQWLLNISPNQISALISNLVTLSSNYCLFSCKCWFHYVIYVNNKSYFSHCCFDDSSTYILNSGHNIQCKLPSLSQFQHQRLLCLLAHNLTCIMVSSWYPYKRLFDQ
jgi:hypothetical protein